MLNSSTVAPTPEDLPKQCAVGPRRLPIGAEPQSAGVHFRVWAPGQSRVRVVCKGDAGEFSSDLQEEANGYFSGLVDGARPGMMYCYRLGEQPQRWPDPASRFQPAGPRGWSRVENPVAFDWHDSHWPGLTDRSQVYYEMHIGTFTPEGNWRAALAELAALADLGVTVLEIMPLGDFPGRFGWGYDVANQFAPSRLYGEPDDVRRFVDAAHQLGLGVILDVVYNHLGRVGEDLLRPFSPYYVSQRHECEWGSALNFDGEHSQQVREFFRANVRYWIEEFHLDGLRIDATQALHDHSPTHIMLELCREARAAAGPRGVLIIGENEPQRAELLRCSVAGGYELDALWNDDFHHSAMVRLTGKREAYYSDYEGSADELGAALQWGFLFQGQRYAWQKHPRGTPALDLQPTQFIHYLQNHDQIANSLHGKRLHELTSPGRYRAMTALLLLGPQSPLLFQGQEFAASSPFFYFNDCGGEDAKNMRQGRAEFLSQFPSMATIEVQSQLPEPSSEQIFRRSTLDPTERARHQEAFRLHRDLLHLRRDDGVLHPGAAGVHAFAIHPDCLAVRFLVEGDTRLLIVNFGVSLSKPAIAHPLIAPPAATRWQILWSSDAPCYGGGGTPELDTPEGWRIPGEAAVVLCPQPREAS